jgi:hypothetical protein
LAKFYEWEMRDIAAAVKWARAAERVARRGRDSWQRAEMLKQIEHRLERLEIKQKGPSRVK